MRNLIAYRPGIAHVDRWFDSFVEDVARPLAGRVARTLPLVDIHEANDAYVLEAELPGLSDKDVDIKVDGNLLTLASAAEPSEAAAIGGAIVQERRSRPFSRSFVLPKDVDTDAIDATFVNGLLTLKIRKLATAAPKQIQINT
jgi:HSP20 family protein